MAMTKAQAQIAAQVDDAIARIVTLVTEGNADGAKAVEAEAEALIITISGNGKAGIMQALRNQVRDALNTQVPAPKAEVALRDTSDVTKVDWLDALVTRGAEQVQMVAAASARGGDSIASILLDIRRRITLADGTPDLMGTTKLARNASEEIYKRVTKGQPEDSDVVLTVKKVKKDTQNRMVDARVQYAKALNNVPAESASQEEKDAHAAEVAMYASIKRDPNETLADAVARHYDFKLKTRGELQYEAKKARELAAADTQAEEADDMEGSGASGGGERPKTSEEIFADSLADIARSLKIIGKLDLSMVFPTLDPTNRADSRQLLVDFRGLINGFLEDEEAADESTEVAKPEGDAEAEDAETEDSDAE